MKTSHTHLLHLLLLLCSASLNAQKAPDAGCYGSDPLLYNGVLYRYYVSPSTTGTQFFTGHDFSQGSVKVRGSLFDKLNLNYDVYNQQLVLLYNTSSGGIDKIVISKAWLEAFTIKDNSFEMHTMDDSISRIYRVLGDDTLKIFFYYTKDLVLGSGVSALNMQFTSLIRDSYLFNGKDLSQFQGNRSFVKLFDVADQQELRRFIRKNKINVKKADDHQMKSLLEYCNSLQT